MEERFPVEYAAWQCGMIRNDLASWDLRGDGVVSSCWRGAFGIPPWGGSNCAGVINPPLTLLFFSLRTRVGSLQDEFWDIFPKHFADFSQENHFRTSNWRTDFTKKPLRSL